jgi:hypothetical protein
MREAGLVGGGDPMLRGRQKAGNEATSNEPAVVGWRTSLEFEILCLPKKILSKSSSLKCKLTSTTPASLLYLDRVWEITIHAPAVLHVLQINGFGYAEKNIDRIIGK